MSTLEQLMQRPAELGEPTARPAALRPSMMPKILALGAALVVAAQVITPPIVGSIEKARIEAKREAAEAEAKERQAKREAEQAVQAKANLERRAGQNAKIVSERRAKVWRDIESVRALASDQAKSELDRESARLALEARPVPADLPSSAAIDLAAAIEADALTFAGKGDAPTVNKALADYQEGTNRAGEYLNQLEAERRTQFRELQRRPRSAPQAPSSWEPPSAPVAAPAPPRATSGAPSARLPAPRPAPEPAQPAKRQVTDW